jgi:hypothetical protein
MTKIKLKKEEKKEEEEEEEEKSLLKNDSLMNLYRQIKNQSESNLITTTKTKSGNVIEKINKFEMIMIKKNRTKTVSLIETYESKLATAKYKYQKMKQIWLEKYKNGSKTKLSRSTSSFSSLLKQKIIKRSNSSSKLESLWRKAEIYSLILKSLYKSRCEQQKTTITTTTIAAVSFNNNEKLNSNDIEEEINSFFEEYNQKFNSFKLKNKEILNEIQNKINDNLTESNLLESKLKQQGSPFYFHLC